MKAFAACLVAAGGALAGWAISFAVSPVYQTAAVIHAPDDVSMLAVQQEVLSRSSLRQIILTNRIYVLELSKQPMEDVVELVRRDLKSQELEDQTFELYFKAPRPREAAVVLPALLAKMSAAGVSTQHSPAPPIREFPVRWQFLIAGAVATLIVGALVIATRRRPKFVALSTAAAAAGALAAWGIDQIVPRHFESVAVVHYADRPVVKQAVARQRFTELQKSIHPGQSFQYEFSGADIRISAQGRTAEEAQKKCRQAVANLMETHVRLQRESSPEPPPPTTTPSFSSLNVNDSDIQTVTRTHLPTPSQPAHGPFLELMDSASLPDSPVGLSDLAIWGLGAAISLCLCVSVMKRYFPAALLQF